nr:PKD-like family lipoprotein [uncultured Chitinophaga sp.]
MKWIYTLPAACLFLLTNACTKDHGNYHYDARETITITGIENAYSKVSLVDRIIITPKVTSTDPGAQFSYWWGIYETDVLGTAPKVDTIGRELKLDYLVKQNAKGWVLVFGAKNERTGFSRIVTTPLNVITRYTRGWYVTKDDGSKTDVDLFLTPAGITPASRIDNVFSLMNHKKLEGKAGLFGFNTNYKSTVTGTLANTRALFILSGSDASVVDINTFQEIHNFDNLFYEAPAVKSPASISAGSPGLFLVNNGHLHSIYTISANTGLFGGARLRDDNNSPYHLSKYFLAAIYWNPFFFDETSSSFVSATGTGPVLSAITDDPGSAMSASKNNKTLLYMGLKTGIPYGGVALFRDKTNPSLKILSTLTPSNYAMHIKNDTLANTQQLYNADQYGLIVDDENILYFSVGNKIWSRNLSNGAEQLQYTLPPDEQLTFIRHRTYTDGGDTEAPFHFNYILVGTASGNRYKVRAFRKTSGTLAANPDFTLEGQGNPGDVLYMAPPVSNYTYPIGY